LFAEAADRHNVRGYTQHVIATGGGFTDLAPDQPASAGNTFTYTLNVTSKTGNIFTISKDASGVVQRTCTRTNTKGGCPSTLSW
jgi:hypothetical protein